MKRNNIFAPLLFLLIAFAPIAKAQVDTVFWFAAPWVTTGNDNNVPVALHISAFNNSTTVRIQQPASTYDTTFVIAANSSFSKDLSHIIATLENQPANTVLGRGLKISSNFPVTAVYEILSNGNNPETFSLKGQSALGTEFLTPFQTKWNGGTYTPTPKSMFCIVATQNNTIVTITPKTAIVGHAAGQTFSITLQMGETYTCENVNSNTSVVGNNLSGSVVVANKPIAITVSDDSVINTTGGGCTNLMGDQIVPTDVIGKAYVVNKGALTASSDEGIFVVASSNFTTVTINNGSVTSIILNKGDTWYNKLTQAITYVTSDKPVYVLHASGFGCELSEEVLPSINCAGSSDVSFIRTNDSLFVMNVTCKTGNEGAFSLNGNTTLLTAASFTVVPGTSGQWKTAQKTFTTAEIPAGINQNLTNTNGSPFSLGILNGSSLSGSRYSNISSYGGKVSVNAGADQNVCSGMATINLTGSVTGGTTSGTWTTPNGTGTISNPSNAITTYLPSISDTTRGFTTFVLTSGGACNQLSDTLVLNFKTHPSANAGTDIIRCANNVGTINLSGTTQNALASIWSGGNGGTFGNTSSLNTTYTPSAADITAGNVSLLLSTVGNTTTCPDVSDTIKLFFTAAPIVNAGTDKVICANTPSVTLSGLVNGVASNGVWASLGSGTLGPNDTTLSGAVYTFSANDTTLGSVIITLSSSNNGLCAVVKDSMIITINDALTVSILGPDTICSSVSINLSSNVTSGLLFDWSTLGSGSFTSTTTANTSYIFSIADITAGGASVVLTSQPGVCSSVSDTLHIVIAPSPVVFAGNDINVCGESTAQLTGTITGVEHTGTWTTNGGGIFFPDANQLNTSYFPVSTDVGTTVQFVLTTTGSLGCVPAADTVNVTFRKLPNANFIGTNVCINQITNYTDQSISATGAIITSWLWKFDDNQTANIASPQHLYNGFGSHLTTLIVTDSYGCIDSVQRYVSVDVIPYAEFSFGASCQNNQTVFNDLSTIAQGNITSWSYDFGDMTPNGTQGNMSHAYANIGFHSVTLTVTSDRGCSNSTTKSVNVLTSPVADFTIGSNPALADEKVVFTDASTGNPASWSWNFGDTTGTNVQNPEHSFESGGNFLITLTIADTSGCIDTVAKWIQIAMLPVLPSAFTPNGDMQNDTLFVRGGPFKSIVFKVYNNWGGLIFQSTEQTKGWDGKYQDMEQPTGVYVWFIEAELKEGKVYKKSGDVTLIR